MKEQRMILKVIIPIMIVSFLLSIFLEFYSAVFAFLIAHGSFLLNIMLGIFSSTGILVVTSFISYFRQKRSALNQYWLLIAGFNQKITEFGILHIQESMNHAKTDDEYIVLAISHLKSVGYNIVPEMMAIHDRYAEVNLAHSKISFTLKKQNPLYDSVEESFLLAGRINQEITNLYKVAANLFPLEDSQAVIDFSKENSSHEQLEKAVNKLAQQLSVKIGEQAGTKA